MKFRCPYCGNTFPNKKSQCPRCGRVLRYAGEATPQTQQQIAMPPQAPAYAQKEKVSVTPFNFWNFIASAIGLAFFIDALLGVHFYYLHAAHGIYTKVPFALIDVLYAFIRHAGEFGTVFSTQGVEAGINLIVKDSFALIDTVSIIIAILVQGFLVLMNFYRLVTKSDSKVAHARNMGRQGQLGSAFSVLIFTYSCVLIPYVFALIYRTTKGNGSFFNNIAESFIRNTYFYGLTYWHLLFVGLFVMLVIAHLIRRGEQKKLQKEEW